MESKLRAPPVVIVHSDAHEDEPWLKRFTTQLRALRVPFWADAQPGESLKDRFKEVLDGAVVVVLLVSADLLASSDWWWEPLCERLRSSRGKNQVAVRSFLVRNCTFDDDQWQEIKPINDQALAAMEMAEAERYQAETARRIRETLRSAFRLEIRDLLNKRPRDVSEHINRIVCLLDQAGPHLNWALSDVADIAAYLLQELLGSGARMPSKQDDPALINRVVRRLVSLCQEASSELKDETYHQLYTVIRCLEALHPAAPIARLVPRPGLSAAQKLLPRWVRTASLTVDAEESWAEVCMATLEVLPSYFADQQRWAPGEERPLPLVRIFHCTWFCALVLKEFPPQASEVRLGLAIILREALRFLCFGFEDNEEQRRPYYYFDAARYTSALRAVVTYHATQVLGKPFEPLISSFLGKVGSTKGVNHYPAAEHLQHILEIYMAGNFMLGARLKGRYNDLTVAEVLRGGKRDQGIVLECQQAFILAALFHDVGHLVLPRIRPDLEGLGLEIPPLRDNLQKLAKSLSDSINSFAKTCVDRLAEYMAEPEMSEWLTQQRERPGHGLLGAAYLLDLCQDSELCDWVRRSAIRAILLHNALSVRLFADQDPIAALLVLCDELFEWDPAQPMTASSIGKSLQVIAPDVPTHEPRDRWIRVDRLRIGDELQALLDVGDAKAAWPRIHIQLQGPQRLTMPIYKLWFRKSQNLGRIVRARCGFQPVLVMTSTFPFHGETNRATIEALKHDLPEDLKPILESWLDAVHIDVRDLEETIHLRSFEDHPELYKELPRLLSYLREWVRPD